jgi:LysM repeat protein
MKRIWWFLFCWLGTCAAALAQEKITAEQYIETYKSLAVVEMQRTGIPASITLAQGLMESGNGNSILAKEANNHFGIKCKKDWKGRSIHVDDDAPQECFRAYDRAEDSYRDHSDFLTTNVRYAFLFKLEPDDYKGWAYGLKSAGYATNPRYPEMLIETIEKYSLYQYDNGNKRQPVLANKEEKKVRCEPRRKRDDLFALNGLQVYEIQAGDDLEKIADKNHMMRWQILKYNDLCRHEPLIPGNILYLKPKMRKAKEEYHVVLAGEGMYYISQLHGIKLKRLYKLNRMVKWQEPKPGETLYLRTMRTTPPAVLPENTITERKGVKIKVEEPPKPAVQLNASTEKAPAPKEPVIIPIPAQISSSAIEHKPVLYQRLKDTSSYHVVEEGETIYGVAKNYGITVQDLQHWNNISDLNISPGQKVRIRRPVERSLMENVISPKSATISPAVPLTDAEGWYTVKAGETLYSISRNSGIPIDTIIKRNHLGTSSLSVGQKLILEPVGKNQEKNVPSEANLTQDFHVVEAGESLYSIAKRYGLTVEELKVINNLADDHIAEGQKLRLKK